MFRLDPVATNTVRISTLAAEKPSRLVMEILVRNFTFSHKILLPWIPKLVRSSRNLTSLGIGLSD